MIRASTDRAARWSAVIAFATASACAAPFTIAAIDPTEEEGERRGLFADAGSPAVLDAGSDADEAIEIHGEGGLAPLPDGGRPGPTDAAISDAD